MNREEHATGRRADLSAAVSLAKAAGVTVAVAARHLEKNTTRSLIESRVAPRQVEAGHLARIKRLADLRVRGIVHDG